MFGFKPACCEFHVQEAYHDEYCTYPTGKWHGPDCYSGKHKKAGEMMIYKNINGPSMTFYQIQGYLDRIGMEAPEKLNLEYLSRLQREHMAHIPFENLDIMEGKPISLDRKTLYDKMILRKRGGVCSEINTLYNWLLESLGYEVTSYNSRIIAAKTPYQGRSHRVIGVKLEKEIYITDAGFNFEHHRIPLLLKADIVQSDGECRYRLERNPFFGWVLWQERPGAGWHKKLGFTEEPQIDMDFIQPTFFAQYHPDSKINKTWKISIIKDGVFRAIRSGNYLAEHGGIEEIIRPVTTKEQVQELLHQVFDIPYEFPDSSK